MSIETNFHPLSSSTCPSCNPDPPDPDGDELPSGNPDHYCCKCSFQEWFPESAGETPPWFGEFNGETFPIPGSWWTIEEGSFGCHISAFFVSGGSWQNIQEFRGQGDCTCKEFRIETDLPLCRDSDSFEGTSVQDSLFHNQE